MTACCRSCGAPIIWVRMETGRRMPVDADSLTTVLVVSGDRTKGAMRTAGTSHFSTCPQADEHRRGK